MTDQPSYYAIIPANVRYANITPNAKLLYGEITALCNKTGTCWASNGYFAGLYETSTRTVQRWLNELKDNRFIGYCGNPNSPNQRGIRLGVPHDKNVVPPDNSVVATHDKNVTHNNTSSNTTKRERAQSLEAFLAKNDHREWFVWSREKFKWPPDRCQTVFDTFRDYWRAQPGQKALKADWGATWRNWCRREGSFEKQKPLAKGEVRVRETSPAEKQAAKLDALYLGFLKEGKPEAEAAHLAQEKFATETNAHWCAETDKNGSAM